MSQDMPWFKCNPAEWLQSCADMESEEFGYYARIILFMYQRGGVAPFDEGKLRHIWNCSRQRARKVRDDLLEAGRIERVGDNLTQGRVKRELRIAEKIDEKLSEKLGKIQQKSSKNPAKTDEVFSDKPLENNETEKQIPDTRYKNQKKRAHGALETSLPSDAQLQAFLSAYPAKGLANTARETVRLQIGQAAVRHGASADEISKAAMAYAERVKRLDTMPISVARWFADRALIAELLEGVSPVAPEALSAAQWRSYVGYFARKGKWEGPGPSPHPQKPGCMAPADVLAEYGYAVLTQPKSPDSVAKKEA